MIRTPGLGGCDAL